MRVDGLWPPPGIAPVVRVNLRFPYLSLEPPFGLVIVIIVTSTTGASTSTLWSLTLAVVVAIILVVVCSVYHSLALVLATSIKLCHHGCHVCKFLEVTIMYGFFRFQAAFYLVDRGWCPCGTPYFLAKCPYSGCPSRPVIMCRIVAASESISGTLAIAISARSSR